MVSNPLECDICCNVFSEDHCPRILPCSDIFCSPCIDGLISAQKKVCPICKGEFTANSVEDLMIIRKLLDAAKQLSSKHVESKTLLREPKKPFLETTNYFRKNILKKGIIVCQGAEAEVKDLIDRYREMTKGVQEVNLSSGKTLSSIDQNIKLLLDRLEKMQKNKIKLKESDAHLEAASDFISAAPLMQEAEDFLQAMEETKTKFQEDKAEECNIKKEILKMKETLEKFVYDTERITEEEQQEEGEQKKERDSVVNIMVTDLRSPHGRFREDAQREIFAVMTFEGKVRVAPVKIESNIIYMNHLEEGGLPPTCFVIELESLMQRSPGTPSPSPSPPPMAFLDLAYGSTHLGRVIISVTEGPKGLNFLYMCAGGMGPSYANSQILKVVQLFFGAEYITMGQYVSHGGSKSTQAVLSSREDWERETKGTNSGETPLKAGDVRGDISYEYASQFWIVTRDHPTWRFGDYFGKVEEGLAVLRSAILKYPNIRQVKVANCGLIL